MDIFRTCLDLKLLEQAINTTTEGIVITDAQHPDNPIVYVNKGFQTLTGYGPQEVLGKNCRFLQGPRTDPEALQSISHALKSSRTCVVELLNYRKDGTEFWNRLSISPLVDGSGITTHYIGVQSDITELRRTQSDLVKANEKLASFFTNTIQEMEQARLTQSILMPDELPVSAHIKFGAYFEPLEQIGGDFYDIVELEDQVYGLLIADATGHGISAAMLTFMTSNTFKGQFPGEFSTSRVISNMNSILYPQMPAGMFVTLYYMIYNAKTKVLTYSQAGNPPALLISQRDKSVEILKTKGTLVGIIPPDLTVFEQKQKTLQPGDKVLLLTDAVLEANNKNGDILDMEALQQYLTGYTELSIDDLISRVYRFGLETAKRTSYLDDTTLAGFQVLG